MTVECAFARLENGLRLAYAEQGPPDGLPIVLLHGTSDSQRSFDLLRPLLPRAWRVFALTLRGHGLSDKPVAGYAMRDFADDLAAFLDAVGVERAVLVGHSMSTAIALQTAAAYPERVAGIVLLAAFGDIRNNPVAAELAVAVAEIGDAADPAFARGFQESTLANPIPDAFLDTAVAESLSLPGHVWRRAVQGML
jgi:pimeloyl-ACP methyl ester carboxylesterase